MEPKPNSASTKYLIVQLITVARIPLAIVFGILLHVFPVTPPVLVAGALLLLVCEITDLLDGWLARRFGVVSEWGAMLDPYADSMSRLIVYWVLASVHLSLLLVPLCMALRDVTVAYCRIVLTRSGRTVSAKWSGKFKAVVQGVGAFLLLLGPIYWPWVYGDWPVAVVSWIIIIVTVASSLEYVMAAQQAMRADVASPQQPSEN